MSIYSTAIEYCRITKQLYKENNRVKRWGLIQHRNKILRDLQHSIAVKRKGGSL